MGSEWTVVISLLITSTVAPFVALVTQAILQSRKERRDYARQDAVAKNLMAEQALTTARAAEAATHAAAALEVAKVTATKIDGMLADRDQAHEAKGERKAEERAAITADALREGQIQGRADERAARETLGAGDTPVSVADKPTQDATERSATALERTAKAAEDAGKKPDKTKK